MTVNATDMAATGESPVSELKSEQKTGFCKWFSFAKFALAGSCVFGASLVMPSRAVAEVHPVLKYGASAVGGAVVGAVVMNKAPVADVMRLAPTEVDPRADSKSAAVIKLAKRAVPIAIALSSAFAIYTTKQFYEAALERSVKALKSSFEETKALRLEMDAMRAQLDDAIAKQKEADSKLSQSSAELRAELETKMLQIAVLETDLACALRELEDLTSSSAAKRKQAQRESDAKFAELKRALEERVGSLNEQIRDVTAHSEKERERAQLEHRAMLAALTERHEANASDVIARHTKQVSEMENQMRQIEARMQSLQRKLHQSMKDSVSHQERARRLSDLAASIRLNDKTEVPVKSNVITRLQADIPVTFEISMDGGNTNGKRVGIVGTWNDWSVENIVLLDRNVDTNEQLWTTTVPIHADDMYEYKYVLVDENDRNNVQWQFGNNRVLALQLALHEQVVLVEVRDDWVPNPEQSPIMLHSMNGSVREVGSTQLLKECVDELRTEHALLLNGGVLVTADAGGEFVDPDGDGPLIGADVQALSASFGVDRNANAVGDASFVAPEQTQASAVALLQAEVMRKQASGGQTQTESELIISDRELVDGVVVDGLPKKAQKMNGTR